MSYLKKIELRKTTQGARGEDANFGAKAIE
jgi:hypothetical protein